MIITDYKTEYHLDYPDYYPGASAIHTDYDEVIVGIGSSEAEAFDDAMEQLASTHDITNLDTITDPDAMTIEIDGDENGDSYPYIYCELYYSMVEGPERDEDIPTWCLCYVINDDPSGLTDEEIAMVDHYFQGVQHVEPIGGTFFSWHPAFGLAGECQDCLITYIKSED